MKFFFLLFLLISCSEKNSNYFPLDKIESWTYAVEIIPEVESKILYKKTNTSIGEKKIKIQNQEKKIFPIKKNKGSAIFIHLTEKYKPTVGCIAIQKNDLLVLLKLIDTKTKIRIS